MTKLEKLLLFILDRAKKAGKTNLSGLQMFKIPYLLQIFALKYAGTSLIDNVIFIREKNGPISIDIYKALEKLEKDKYVKKEIIDNEKYGYPKHAYSLAKKLPKLDFEIGETIFIDNFLAELFPLTQMRLKEMTYNTEPMKEIQKRETDYKIKKGFVLNFSTVTVDPDVVDVYSDAI